ncbi:SPOR domain-containing protein [Chitinivorax sp. B]|uniref:SPOR domain-containing protein n=1 Tax=Chitinivorax sp. B TaxID=2502235 RepID=UPI0010F6B7CF|nr:SPOR domain-containing protein [Chitinivorax sp. B]
MKWLFFGLVVTNLLVYGYTHLSEPPVQDWHQREFHADSVKLVTDTAPMTTDTGKDEKSVETPVTPPASDATITTQPTPTKVAETPANMASAQQCIRWDAIPMADLPRAKQLLDTLKIGKPLGNARIEAKTRFWVYILPQSSLSDAQKKTEELQALGLSERDFFIVNDAGRWRNAISLGVYSTQDAARQRLDAVQEKGVKSARVGIRDTLRFASLIIAQADEGTGSRLAGASAEIKGSEVNLAECPR